MIFTLNIVFLEKVKQTQFVFYKGKMHLLDQFASRTEEFEASLFLILIAALIIFVKSKTFVAKIFFLLEVTNPQKSEILCRLTTVSKKKYFKNGNGW